jgi:primosomal protein N' (replication factor Y)
MGAAGSARTAHELGKSFPGTLVIESTHSKRILNLEQGKKLVVATPGCEPVVTGGYALVVLLDCGKLVSRDTLRATEYALQQWANASSLCSGKGQVIAVGMPESLSKPFSQWKLIELASNELKNRRELGFTPAVRMASISGSSEVVGILLSELKPPTDIKASRIEILGPFPLDHSTVRAIIRYDYALGSWLAGELRSQILKTVSGSTSKNPSNGRVSRSVRVKMDDAELV